MQRPRRSDRPGQRPGRTALVVVVLGASLLNACGGALDATGDDGTPDEVTESADDCEVTADDDTCDDTAPQDEGLGTEAEYPAMLSDAAALVGTAEGDLPDGVRVSRRGDEELPVTDDHVVGRRTVQLDQDGAGIYVVTTLDVELPDGVVRLPPED
jgi:hypothetical protein